MDKEVGKDGVERDYEVEEGGYAAQRNNALAEEDVPESGGNRQGTNNSVRDNKKINNERDSQVDMPSSNDSKDAASITKLDSEEEPMTKPW